MQADDDEDDGSMVQLQAAVSKLMKAKVRCTLLAHPRALRTPICMIDNMRCSLVDRACSAVYR